MKKTGFIGAGKVGFALGKFMKSKGKEIAGYYSRNTASAALAAQYTDSTSYEDLAALVRASDVLFLTVPDGSISRVFEEVSRYPIRGKYICHCSGALSAEEAFPGVGNTGAHAFSVHPLFAVSDPYRAYRELADVFFVLEGEEAHLPEMERFLADLSLRVRTIRSAQKTRYHVAAVMASNLVIALLSESIDLLAACGFSEEEARGALAPLVRGNVEHVLKDGAEKALTGPAERGDAATIRKHFAVMEQEDTRRLYELLTRKLLAIAEKKHPQRAYEAVWAVLEEESGTSRKEEIR